MWPCTIPKGFHPNIMLAVITALLNKTLYTTDMVYILALFEFHISIFRLMTTENQPLVQHPKIQFSSRWKPPCPFLVTLTDTNVRRNLEQIVTKLGLQNSCTTRSPYRATLAFNSNVAIQTIPNCNTMPPGCAYGYISKTATSTSLSIPFF